MTEKLSDLLAEAQHGMGHTPHFKPVYGRMQPCHPGTMMMERLHPNL